MEKTIKIVQGDNEWVVIFKNLIKLSGFVKTMFEFIEDDDNDINIDLSELKNKFTKKNISKETIDIYCYLVNRCDYETSFDIKNTFVLKEGSKTPIPKVNNDKYLNADKDGNVIDNDNNEYLFVDLNEWYTITEYMQSYISIEIKDDLIQPINGVCMRMFVFNPKDADNYPFHYFLEKLNIKDIENIDVNDKEVLENNNIIIKNENEYYRFGNYMHILFYYNEKMQETMIKYVNEKYDSHLFLDFCMHIESVSLNHLRRLIFTGYDVDYENEEVFIETLKKHIDDNFEKMKEKESIEIEEIENMEE